MVKTQQQLAYRCRGSPRAWKVLDAIIWTIIFFSVAFWISAFCTFWNFFLDPLSVFISPLRGISKMLRAGAFFPHDCAENILAGKDVLEYFFPYDEEEKQEEEEEENQNQVYSKAGRSLSKDNRIEQLSM